MPLAVLPPSAKAIKNMSFLRDTGGAAVLQLLGAAFQFFAGVIVAKYLLPDGRGVFALVVLVPEITRSFAHFGFGTASTRLIAKDHGISARVSLNAISFCVAVSLLCCAGLVAFFPWLLEFAQGDGFEQVVAAKGGIELALYISIFSLPLLILEGYLGGQLVAVGAVLSANVAKVVQTSSFLLLLLVLFYTQGASVAVAIVARVASFAIGNLFAFYKMTRIWKGPKRLSFVLIRSAFKFGLRTLPASVAVFLLFRIDIALVRQWRPIGDVGIYSVAASLAMMFQVIGFAVERALVPRLMSREASETKVLTPLATRGFVMLGFPVALVAALVAYPLIPIIFGAEYSAAALPFTLFLPGLVFANVGQICNTDLIGRGHPQWASISASIAVVVNITLNVVLIPRLGIVGAALASLICYTQHGLTLAVMYSRVAGVKFTDMIIPTKDDINKIKWLLGKRG